MQPLYTVIASSVGPQIVVWLSIERLRLISSWQIA